MPASKPPTPGSKRILVVDDDPSIRRSVRLILAVGGYDVLEADSAQEALQVVEDAPPDLVIMDLVLPTMRGRECANLLQAHQPRLPILFVSGYTNQESIRLGLMTEGEAFLRKPFEIDELRQVVQDVLERSPDEGGGLSG